MYLNFPYLSLAILWRKRPAFGRFDIRFGVKTGKTLPNGKLLPVSKNCRSQIVPRLSTIQTHSPHYQFVKQNT